MEKYIICLSQYFERKHTIYHQIDNMEKYIICLSQYFERKQLNDKKKLENVTFHIVSIIN
jgi:hypothetical protein